MALVTEVQKMNVLRSCIFDVTNSKHVDFKFYDMCLISGEHCSKAVTLFNKTDRALSKDGIDWDNTITSGLDNANLNMGCYNLLKSITVEKNSSYYAAGCNYHLVHLAAGGGKQAFANQSGFNCEQDQFDLFYFLKDNSRTKGILAEYLEFVDLELQNLIRYLKT